ncbi:uncharacterized protein EV420DRAFT_1281667, partial [Desarmillaria tabescens]
KFVADQTGAESAAVTTDLSGKTLVLIGANVVLGSEAAKHFTRTNPARFAQDCMR